jgi:ribosomal protein S18 acetylase RimI-like enzyme
MTSTPDLFLQKARRRDWREMKACNERNLKENYDNYDWPNWLTQYPGRSVVLTNQKHEVKGYILFANNVLISVAVDQKHRGQGWGKKMLQFCLQLNHDIPVVSLHVRVSNHIAIKLYTDMGFCVEETVSKYYLIPEEDAFLMKRIQKPSEKKLI